MQKKLISALLAASIAVGSLSIPSSAYTGKFTDVSSNAWYHSAVDYCAQNGYMNGEAATVFNPTGTVSRAQVVQVLYNLEGQPAVTHPSSFDDVADDIWYADAVSWAQKHGVVDGESPTTFNPDGNVTREQVAVMFRNYAKFKDEDVSSDKSIRWYRDYESISTWAKDALSWAVQRGLISGIGDDQLDPTGTCTRAQLAQIIKNYFEPTIDIEQPEATVQYAPEPDWMTLDEILTSPPEIGSDYLIFPGYKVGAQLEPHFDLDRFPVKSTPEDGTVVTDTYGRWTELGYIPKNGYVKDGRIYNSLDFDVTGVDGVPTRKEMKVLDMVNVYREANGLQPVEWNEGLQGLADERAIESGYYRMCVFRDFIEPGLEDGTVPVKYYLASSGSFAHCVWTNGLMVKHSEGGKWYNGCNYANKQNFFGKYVGSGVTYLNEIVNTGSVDGSAGAWYNSPGHKKVMLDGTYTKAAVGIYGFDTMAEKGYMTYVTVMIFG